MAELLDRARLLAQKLADLDAPLIEISLIVLCDLVESITPDDDLDTRRAHERRLEGAVVIAESVVEQLNAPAVPFAIDGDVHYRHGATAPGKATRRLLEQFAKADSEAIAQREGLLRPLALAAMQLGQAETRERFGV